MQTFVLCPIAVVAVDAALHAGKVEVVGWGAPRLIWGYCQYLIVGHYRLPRAGGSAGMQTLPDRMITTGPYRYTRNPMYLGHLIFLLGLAVTFWSLFGVLLLSGPPFGFIYLGVKGRAAPHGSVRPGPAHYPSAAGEALDGPVLSRATAEAGPGHSGDKSRAGNSFWNSLAPANAAPIIHTTHDDIDRAS